MRGLHIRRLLTHILLVGLIWANSQWAQVAQSQTDALTAQVDSLFVEWDKPDTPGCVCAVMQDGKIVYARGYGMANLEHDTALSPESVFYIASTSKQFTAACIALLSQRGVLSLDDDIRKYVPEIHDFGETITIRNLIHHTSGIRDYPILFFVKGFYFEDNITNDKVLALLSRQKTLNFKPGQKLTYSNSNYVLLAEIVERVSGKSLREFAEGNIFNPLGMKQTHFDDDYRMIVKNRVSSYEKKEDGNFARYLKSFNVVGDGGLLTTVTDLNRWQRNFYDCKLGGQEFVNLLLTKGKLKNGRELDYGFGLAYGNYRGTRIVRHGGGLQGFRTELLHFPDQRFSVAVLCNLASMRPGVLAKRVANLYLAEHFTERASRPRRKISSEDYDIIDVPAEKFQRLVGYYRTGDFDEYRQIYLKEDQLYCVALSGQNERRLVPLRDGRFLMLGIPREIILKELPTEPEEPKRLEWYRNGEMSFQLEGYRPWVPRTEELAQYTGLYYSQELDTAYTLAVKKGKLIAQHHRVEDVELKSQGEKDNFRGTWKFESMIAVPSMVVFQRDNAEQITGLHFSSGRVTNLMFERQKGLREPEVNPTDLSKEQ